MARQNILSAYITLAFGLFLGFVTGFVCAVSMYPSSNVLEVIKANGVLIITALGVIVAYLGISRAWKAHQNSNKVTFQSELDALDDIEAYFKRVVSYCDEMIPLATEDEVDLGFYDLASDRHKTVRMPLDLIEGTVGKIPRQIGIHIKDSNECLLMAIRVTGQYMPNRALPIMIVNLKRAKESAENGLLCIDKRHKKLSIYWR